ncbi:AMP-binding protein [Nocardia uniformis]|uniref:AMP-binding protein n=1 Tax=Nocardia uniformis TaxID=53432 RepID=A0A849C2P3_9NOCA|nr:AMP-binding protein [Nocardia uniformis]NNH71826.1 AMP-binding protein [Nocardia uniformis]
MPDTLSAFERHRLVDEWANGVELSGHPGISTLIERGRRVPAIRTAVRCGANILTYAELFDRIGRPATAERCERSMDGAVRLLADIAEAANSGVVLTLSVPTGSHSAAPRSPASTIALHPDALAAAVDDRRAVATDCRTQHVDRAMGSSDVRLLATDWACADTAVELLAALADGATLVVATEAQRQDPAALAELIATCAATHVVADANTLSRFTDTFAPTLASVRRWDVTGTRCPAILPGLLREIAPGSVAGFAYTAPEYAGVAARGPLDGSGRVRPIPGARVLVLDEALQPVPAGGYGQLFLGGAALAAEVPDTAADFVADPFTAGGRLCRTGIFGQWTADGWLTFTAVDSITNSVATLENTVSITDVGTVGETSAVTEIAA